jgi:hypothetical protein
MHRIVQPYAQCIRLSDSLSLCSEKLFRLQIESLGLAIPTGMKERCSQSFLVTAFHTTELGNWSVLLFDIRLNSSSIWWIHILQQCLKLPGLILGMILAWWALEQKMVSNNPAQAFNRTWWGNWHPHFGRVHLEWNFQLPLQNIREYTEMIEVDWVCRTVVSPSCQKCHSSIR